MRVLTSHQYGPDWIPARCHIWVELPVGCSFAPIVFLQVLPPPKPTFPSSNLTSIEDLHESQPKVDVASSLNTRVDTLPAARHKPCNTQI